MPLGQQAITCCFILIIAFTSTLASNQAAATSPGHPAARHARAKAAAAAATGAAAAPAVGVTPPYHCPPHAAVFSSPWVRQHVALSYAPETTRDGLGAQAVRLLGIFALAHCTGLQYVHAPVQCVGHIGGLAHYQGRSCSSRMTKADHRRLARVQQLLSLPSSATAPGAFAAAAAAAPAVASAGNASTWHVVRLDDTPLTWPLLQQAVQGALQRRRPTLIKLARVQALLCQNPGIFLALPQLQPTPVKPALPGALWLDHLRLAVHMRRGDITANASHVRRVLPARYYLNVISALLQELSRLGRQTTVEVFTERPPGRAGRRELAQLADALPGLVLHLSTEDTWSWAQMGSADILVLSLSTYGVVPALLNPRALVISPPPYALDGSPLSALRMPHWLGAADHNGSLAPATLQAVRGRFRGTAGGRSSGTAGRAGSAGGRGGGGRGGGGGGGVQAT